MSARSKANDAINKRIVELLALKREATVNDERVIEIYKELGEIEIEFFTDDRIQMKLKPVYKLINQILGL